MKRKKIVLGIIAAAMISAVTFTVNAQEKKTTVGKAMQKTGRAAESVGNKTAEVAVKGTAKIVDAKYKGRIAPDGSDVYIDGKNNKYYINSKGAKIYLKASQIRMKRNPK